MTEVSVPDLGDFADVPVIVFTAFGSLETAVAAIRSATRAP